MSSHRIAILSCLCFLTGIQVARADLPPPPGYVEKCTVERKEQPGTLCEACRNSYEGLGANNPCKQKFAGSLFEYVCKSWGASVWDEVWCIGPPR